MAYREGFIGACHWPEPVIQDTDSSAFKAEVDYFVAKHTPETRSNAKAGEVDVTDAMITAFWKSPGVDVQDEPRDGEEREWYGTREQFIEAMRAALSTHDKTKA
jgi:hypothetical protein